MYQIWTKSEEVTFKVGRRALDLPNSIVCAKCTIKMYPRRNQIISNNFDSLNQMALTVFLCDQCLNLPASVHSLLLALLNLKVFVKPKRTTLFECARLSYSTHDISSAQVLHEFIAISVVSRWSAHTFSVVKCYSEWFACATHTFKLCCQQYILCFILTIFTIEKRIHII